MRDYTSFVGRVLNRTYRLEKLIKRGGMGAVYLASHSRLPRMFAVKVISADTDDEPQLLERFRREAQITCSLRHPNIVEVLDYDQDEEGVPYLVMELLEGEDLGQRIRRVAAPFDVEVVLRIFLQAAAGLGAAHQCGIVHRDIKPNNLFLVRAGSQEVLKVLDFGVSKILGASSSLTATQTSIGTPRYMAPEQVRRAGQVDQRADTFALGAILYELLAGRPAFDGDSMAQVIYAVLNDEPAPLAVLRPDLGRPVVATIEAMLRKDPEQRPPSLANALDMLEDPRAARQAAELRREIGAVFGSHEIRTVIEEVPDSAETWSGSSRSTPPSATPIPPAESGLFFAVNPSVAEGAAAQPAAAAPTSPPISTLSGGSGQILVPAPAPSAIPIPRWLLIALPSVAVAATAAVVMLITGSGDQDRRAAKLVAALALAPDANPVPAVRPPTVDAAAPRLPDANAATPDLQPKKVSLPQKRPRGQGTVRVMTTSGGDLVWADVFIDGQHRGRSPLSLTVPAGPLRIEVRREGYEVASRRLVVQRDTVTPALIPMVSR